MQLAGFYQEWLVFFAIWSDAFKKFFERTGEDWRNWEWGDPRYQFIENVRIQNK